MEYKVYKLGQITKFEAGTLYRASKENKINVPKEFISDIYNQVNAYIRYADERYSQEAINYDRIYTAVESIVNSDYEKAQEKIDEYIQDNIKRATRKSLYFNLK